MAQRQSRPGGQDRRTFIKTGGVVTAALLARPGRAAAQPAAPGKDLPWNPKTAGSMPTRNLGRTGHRVGVFSLGGQAALERGGNEATAVAIV